MLLERCTYDVVEFGKANNASAIAQLILDLRRNNVEMDSKLLNTVMGKLFTGMGPVCTFVCVCVSECV